MGTSGVGVGSINLIYWLDVALLWEAVVLERGVVMVVVMVYY